MTNKELQEYLSQLPDDAEILIADPMDDGLAYELTLHNLVWEKENNVIEIYATE